MKRHSARGASLVEVAIALLLVSAGTLGLAGLQLAAKRMGYQAVQRSAAAGMAVDLLERMRANRSVLQNYRVSGLGAAAGGRLPAPLASCESQQCSPAQRAFFDLWEWERILNGELTSRAGGGLVRPFACVAVDGRHVAVAISWAGTQELDAGPSADRCGEPAGPFFAAEREGLRMTTWIASN